MESDKRRTQPTTVWRQGNVISFYDLKHHGRVGDFVSSIFKARHDGYRSFIIKLPNTEAAFPNACVPLAALIAHYRECNLKIKVEHASGFCGIAQIDQPVIASPEAVASRERHMLSTIWEFHDDYMITTLINGFVDVISKQVECKAGVLAALEWCLGEIMDNVIQHSGEHRGFVAVQIHPRGNTVAICIADTGVGIYRSLKETQHRPRDAVEAIELATRKGVTRDTKIGAGNGLWGLMQIVKNSSGVLAITSGKGMLRFESGLEKTNRKVPYPDPDHQCAFVDFQLDTGRVIDIENAIGGHLPVDLHLESFESETGEHVVPLLKNARGPTTRRSGENVRTLVRNLLHQGSRKVIIDFTGVRMVSSSFADELVGMLLKTMGVLDFQDKIGFRGMNNSVRVVVDAVLYQRIQECV